MKEGNKMTDLKANSYLAVVAKKNVLKPEFSHVVRCTKQGVGARVSVRRSHYCRPLLN